ncbi:Na+/H+ antiporter subunit G [Roseobacter sp. HKCCD9010]|uniref:monovalent cation/H(+) antiporter subunit G n=1 Tax=unclassified Roseobacter TaxID=196798 RepID=UPI001491A7DF|nr:MULTISPECIES: monovalent cation/H(+) antiporter subunit G [unclassified Roseobacter]MBF9052350.1 Na+/H+ antiporter subunit G [Rhodobacterales bacterium HKCCD4356]NNV14337.1 Na+/H+ antiporter subunit G [Roseobacter sp. HKCCD7357]NNV18516.1 Na+/H+ antiporter subunit G [Roseobacter sp. HKCCD8768]NNV27954.1 Na+/H+ antiporter subunit G [Roseobacter sp. HKCCD8192]NNV32232.1 Na+/H+ antiporter subunit G [Roseobacter sp. HKCCD9061]
MSWEEIPGTALIVAGCFYFLAGTVGLLRFPDVYSRLHALTKADNLGLALVLTGAGLIAADAFIVGKLLLIWLLVALASATGGHLIARHALEDEQ